MHSYWEQGLALVSRLSGGKVLVLLETWMPKSWSLSRDLGRKSLGLARDLDAKVLVLSRDLEKKSC